MVTKTSTSLAEENPLKLTAHHMTATVVDLERAAAWYRDVLGFRLVEKGSRELGSIKFAELEIPGFGIGLVQTSTSSTNALIRPIGPGWLHIVFSVPDPDLAFHTLKQRGAEVTMTRQNARGFVNSFLIHDSEGNEIEILNGEHPH